MSATINQAQYEAGKAAFFKGATIRTLVEQLGAADKAGADDSALMSYAVGFGDAFLIMLRGQVSP